MLFTIFNSLYLLVWSILLIHCLRNDKFFPVFGKGLSTKYFWIFTFIFFNPFLSLLYFLYEVLLHRIKKISVKKLYLAFQSVAIVSTCLILFLFELPRSDIKSQPGTVINKSGESSTNQETFLTKSGLNIGLIQANNKIQTISSNNMMIDISNIILIRKSNNYLLDLVARKIQASLVSLSYIDNVTYYSYYLRQEQNESSSDIYIILEMPEIDENKFLLGRKLSAKIICKAGNSIIRNPADSDTEQIVAFKIESELQHTSKSIAIECPGTEYKHEVNNISNELIQAIKKQFENMLSKYAKEI